MRASTAAIKVSVVICAYNAQASLGRAIESALAQRGVYLEIIVVDDCSSDGTYDVARSFEQAHPTVRAIRLESNRGAGGARNAAFEVATGEWIALLDADDAFAPGRLLSLLGLADTWDADMAADNLWLVDGASGRPFDLMLHRDRLCSQRLISASAFVQNNMPIEVKRKYGLLKPIMKRSFIERHGLRYDENVRYGEDFLLYLDCLIKGARFAIEPEAHYFYSLSRGSLTRVRPIEQAEGFLEHCDRLLQRSEVRSNPSLVAMLTNRSFQMQSDLIYIRFTAALKQARLGAASKHLAAHPELTHFILVHAWRVIFLRSMQQVSHLLSAIRSRRSTPRHG